MFKRNNIESFDSDKTYSLEMETINKKTKTCASKSDTQVLNEISKKVKSHIDGKELLTTFQVEKCLKDIIRMNLKSFKSRTKAWEIKSILRRIFKQTKSFEDKILNIQEVGSANRNFSLDCGISEDIKMLDDHINNLLNPTMLPSQGLSFDTNMLHANFLTDDNKGINRSNKEKYPKIADFLSKEKGDSDMLEVYDGKMPTTPNLCKDVRSSSKQTRNTLLSPDETGTPFRYVKKSTLSPQNDVLFRKPSFIYKKIVSSSQIRSAVVASNLSLNKDNNPKNTFTDFVNVIPDDPNPTNDSKHSVNNDGIIDSNPRNYCENFLNLNPDSNPTNDPKYSSNNGSISDSIPLNDSENVANIIPDSNPTDNGDYSAKCGSISDSNPTNADPEYSINNGSISDSIPLNDSENVVNIIIPDSNPTDNWDYAVKCGSIPDSNPTNGPEYSSNNGSTPDSIPLNDSANVANIIPNSNPTDNWDYSVNCGRIPDFIPLNHCHNKIATIIPDSNPTNDWEYSMDNEFIIPDFIHMNDCENIANIADSNNREYFVNSIGIPNNLLNENIANIPDSNLINKFEYSVNVIPDSKLTNRETSLSFDNPNFIGSSTEEEISKSVSDSNSTECEDLKTKSTTDCEDLSYKDPNLNISPNSVDNASATTTEFNSKNGGEELCGIAGKYRNSLQGSGSIKSIDVAKNMAVADCRKNIQDFSYLAGSRKSAITPKRLDETIFLEAGKLSEISPAYSSKKIQKLIVKDGSETKNASNLQRGNDSSKLEPLISQFSDHISQDFKFTKSNSDDEDEETLKASFEDWVLVLQEVKQEPRWAPRFLKLW